MVSKTEFFHPDPSRFLRHILRITSLLAQSWVGTCSVKVGWERVLAGRKLTQLAVLFFPDPQGTVAVQRAALLDMDY